MGLPTRAQHLIVPLLFKNVRIISALGVSLPPHSLALTEWTSDSWTPSK